MKTVEVLGTGCPKCKKLFEIVQKVVRENKLDAEVVKIEDIQTIVAKGVMMTPGLVVDGVVKSVGKVLSEERVRELIEG